MPTIQYTAFLKSQKYESHRSDIYDHLMVSDFKGESVKRKLSKLVLLREEGVESSIMSFLYKFPRQNLQS